MSNNRGRRWRRATLGGIVLGLGALIAGIGEIITAFELKKLAA